MITGVKVSQLSVRWDERGDFEMTARAARCARDLGGVARTALLLASLYAAPAFGLGLGEIRVKSSLGEPLVAEIELTSVTAGELSTLEVKLGAPEVFDNAGLIRHAFLTQLDFEVVGAAAPIIRVTSQMPISEPFLQFIVRARWDFGMLLGEYTALLDPPLYAQQQPGSTSTPVMLEETDRPAVSSVPEAPDAEPVPETPARIPATAGGIFQYGPVAPGDNLWDIASQVDVSGLGANVFQVMIALLRENPNAFIGNNINRLKLGETLRLDSSDAIVLISKAEASRAYRAQTEEWEAGRAGAAVAEAPAGPDATEIVDMGTPSAHTAKPAADARAPETAGGETARAQPVDKDKYVFKIAPPETKSGAGASEAPPDAEVEVEAMRAAIDREIAALREQVAKLEEQQKESEALSSSETQIESVRAEAEEEITGLREQIAFLKQAAAEQEILALRGQLSAMSKEAEMSQRASGTSAALAAAQQEIKELRAQVASLTQGPAEDAAGLEDPSERPGAAPQSIPADDATDTRAAAEAIRTAASAQITALREQMEAMRVEMGELMAAQRLRERENSALEQRVAELIAALEGKVESSTLAASTTPAAGPTESESGAANNETRVASGFEDGAPVWQAWIDRLPRDNQTRIAIAAGVLLILLVLWLIIRRRNALLRMEESILMTSGTLDGQVSSLSEVRAKRKERYLSDLSMVGMGRMEAAEVDPVAEADVYLAYGRAEQALEVLKEAALRHPERKELQIKLLEIYQQQGDFKSFDDLVSDLNLTKDAMDQTAWGKVVALKLKMRENSPLKTAEPSAEADAPTDDLPAPDVGSAAWELPLEEGADTGTAASRRSSNPPPSNPESIDPALRPFPEPDENARLGEDVLVSLGRTDTRVNPGPPADAAEATPVEEEANSKPEDADMLNFAAADSPELDFDLELGLDETPDAGAASPGTPETDTAPAHSPSHDPGPDEGFEQGGKVKEIPYKTELAEAYLNMGDKAEALRILEGIVESAGPEDKEHIADLMRRAGQ